MTWHIQWIRMVAKRPRLSDPKALVTISREQFQSLLSQAYEKGVKDAKASSKVRDTIDDIFKGMF